MDSTPQQHQDEAVSLFQQGQYRDALARFETAVSLCAAQGDKAGQAEMLNNIGVVHRILKQYQAAATALQQAAEIFAELNDLNHQGQTLGNLGDLYAAQRQREDAARAYSNAAALFAQCNDGSKQSQVLRALSLLKIRQGQWVAAMLHMNQSLEVKPRRSPADWLLRFLLRLVIALMGRN